MLGVEAINAKKAIIHGVLLLVEEPLKKRETITQLLRPTHTKTTNCQKIHLRRDQITHMD